MRRIIILILAGLALPLTLSAQEDIRKMFKDFQDGASSAMREFQDEAQKNFAETLAAQWEEFQVFQGHQSPRKPDPKVLPVAPEGEKPEMIDIPTIPELPELDVEVEDVPEEPVVEEPAPLDTTPSMTIDLVQPKFAGPSFDMGGSDPRLGFSWYGMMANMAPPRYLVMNSPGLMTDGDVDLSGESIARFWMALDDDDAAPVSFKADVLSSFKEARSTQELSDWSLYQLVISFSERWWKDRSEQAVVQTFMLNNLGIDARLARIDEALVLLLPARQKIYGLRFIKMEDDVYYIMCDDGISKLFTYPIAYSGDLAGLDMALSSRDLVFRSEKATTVEKPLPTLGLTLSLPLRKSRCMFYWDYPLVDIGLYAGETVDKELADALVKQFQPLRKFDEAMAVNLLLHSIQKDFQYATDQDQFGFEKPYFVAENFVYPCNDCEDRSILFAFLVRNVFNLDVVLLDYPEHLATAVCFSNKELKGAYVTHEGKRYLVCDPTYVGADIGMVMPMYKETAAKVVKI